MRGAAVKLHFLRAWRHCEALKTPPGASAFECRDLFEEKDLIVMFDSASSSSFRAAIGSGSIAGAGATIRRRSADNWCAADRSPVCILKESAQRIRIG
jgi:hypothetical protein